MMMPFAYILFLATSFFPFFSLLSLSCIGSLWAKCGYTTSLDSVSSPRLQFLFSFLFFFFFSFPSVSDESISSKGSVAPRKTKEKVWEAEVEVEVTVNVFYRNRVIGARNFYHTILLPRLPTLPARLVCSAGQIMPVGLQHDDLE
jgi:hypothetical protein